MSDTLTMGKFSVARGELGSDHPLAEPESFELYPPLGFDAGDGNLYRYVGNDPTNETDPSGLQATMMDNRNKRPAAKPATPSTVGGAYKAKLVFTGGFTAQEQQQLQAATYAAAQRIHRALYVLENDSLWKQLQAQGTKGYLFPNPTGQKLELPTLVKTSPVIENLNKDRAYWVARLKEAYKGLTDPNSAVNYYKTSKPPSSTESELTTTFYGIPYTRQGVNGSSMYVYSVFWGVKDAPTSPEHKANRVTHELGRCFSYLPDQTPRIPYVNETTLADSPIIQWDSIIDYINNPNSNRYNKIINNQIKVK